MSVFIPTVISDIEYVRWCDICDVEGWKRPASKEEYGRTINQTRRNIRFDCGVSDGKG